MAFVASQVVIDCEPLYYMLRRDFPVHRTLHTFAGATLAGSATAVALIGVMVLLGKPLASFLRYEVSNRVAGSFEFPLSTSFRSYDHVFASGHRGAVQGM